MLKLGIGTHSLIFVDSRTTVLASLFTPASKAAPLYSVDMGGYWIAKRKGGEEWAKVQLMKAGNRTESELHSFLLVIPSSLLVLSIPFSSPLKDAGKY